MVSFRANGTQARTCAARQAPGLRAVSRVAPPRPRWRALYGTLATIVAAGAAAHLVAHDAVLVTVADAAVGLALFLALAGWIHLNRIALCRLDEPEAGAGRPQIRIVRSRRRRLGDDAAATRRPTARSCGSIPGTIERARRSVMDDVLYLGLAVGFFLLSWAFVTLCERV
jgi:hypothetical protein